MIVVKITQDGLNLLLSHTREPRQTVINTKTILELLKKGRNRNSLVPRNTHAPL